MKAVDLRDGLVEFIYRDLIGPAHGDEEELEEPPRVRYGAGALFPQQVQIRESDVVGGSEGDGDGREENEPLEPADNDKRAEGKPGNDEPGSGSGCAPHDEDTVTLANSYKPSAMGLSFMTDRGTKRLKVSPRAAVYKTRQEQVAGSDYVITKYKRQPLDLKSVEVVVGGEQNHERRRITDGLALHVVCRPTHDDDVLTTVSLYNTSEDSARNAPTFFQVGFSVESVDGEAIFPEYRSAQLVPDDEELALSMLYRERRVFAAGHGCAAGWSDFESNSVRKVFTDVLPRVTVPPVQPRQAQPDSGEFRYLDMQYLWRGCADPETEIPAALEQLCLDYESWIHQRRSDVTTLDEEFHRVATNNVELAEVALHRMRAGIEILASDRVAREAFTLVNQVMLMQQHHARRKRKLADAWEALPESDEDYTSDLAQGRGFWRHFQLAFILMTIPGLCYDDEQVSIQDLEVRDRDLVDLIWFPTGGGKTEAYLGVAVFVIFMSRLREREDRGCKVLMRYTLRLLTSQQFQRAASVICACELVRRRSNDRYGDSPISIGLWVGLSLTPNTEQEAKQTLTKLARQSREEEAASDSEAKNKFQLLSCPWCGTELNNVSKLGYDQRQGRHIFLCPQATTSQSPGCPFSVRSECLPICVVDQSIYKDPPTLIIGTVDKFAMLAWRREAQSLFSNGPELIIQDELHLISGPLGSMVGLYESVIDYLSTRNGRRPKIIASTATIRRAREQCKALYDREMFQFPPSGLDASDSYFAQEDITKPGRLYVGFLPTAASSSLTAQVRSIAALLQGTVIVGDGKASDETLDPYWTLVQYFGSLKELGRAATFVTADIPEFLPQMYDRYELAKEARRYIQTQRCAELTSRKNEDEIPKILKRLEVEYRHDAPYEDQALDTVLATNMISVGVDVERLGMMMIVTQPKGTSEYIQASSRVGRSERSPGLIFMLYNAGRPRDRSHYEQFRAYHDAFYRFVEPTSVTPFSPPAMDRALHSVVAIAGRHVAEWKSPNDVDFEDDAMSTFLEFLEARVESVDPEHLDYFRKLLKSRKKEWLEMRPDTWGSVAGAQEGETVLLVPAGNTSDDDDEERWETPTSMRNVDVECFAGVVARYPSLEEDD